jgi:ribosomal protein L11 methyltransferase
MNEAGRKSRPGPEARLWTKVVIETGRGSCEEVALFLAELTGGGVECVSVSDRGRSPREQVVGYLGSDALNPSHKSRPAAFLEELGARDPLAAPVLVRSEPMPEEDWRHIWRTHFRVSRLTPRLVVRPPWEEYVPKGEERVLEIDPGMAFGTGLHASTRLTLSFIDDLCKEPEETGRVPIFPETVLDIGVGTGILSMACARLGARNVTAIDNDPAAVRAAEGNIRRNGLERIVKVSGVDLAAVPGSFDLITANMFHNVLVELAARIVRRLRVPGTLLCSGILEGGQEESLRQVFEGRGLHFTESRHEGEWAALRFDRTGDDPR